MTSTTATEKRREGRRVQVVGMWIAALQRLGGAAILDPDQLAPAMRDRLATLETNARNCSLGHVCGVATLAEVRQTLEWWSSAMVEAARSIERKVVRA